MPFLNAPSQLNRRALLGSGAVLTLSACSPLTALNTVMPADAGSRLAARDVAYGADPRQRLDVYVPEGGARNAPVMMFVYGGGWDNGNKADYAFVGLALASRGFVTVVPDYRLVPQVRFPDFVDDCARALRWAQDNAASLGGDPRRLHLSGHSAGAYNVMMIGLDGRFLRRAGVRAGSLRSVAGLAGPYDFLPFEDRRTRAAFESYPRPAETQPVTFARRDAPRILLATGDADRTVYPRNTEALARRLRAAGATVSVKIYPGVGHPGIVLALGRSFRGNAPVLDDIVGFARG